MVASAYATLHDISDGRMVMGIGRGDSARRYINQQPVRVRPFEDALRMIKPFMNGEKVEWNGTEIELTWVRPSCRRSRCTWPATGRRCSRSRDAWATA